ncbi:MAG: flagellar basal body-associated FliL family protein [Myxococcota bacterium]
MADEEENDVKPSGGGTSKILLILVLVNVLGLAGLAAYLVLFQNTAAPAEAQEGEEEEGEDSEEAEPDPFDIGTLVEMEPLIVNVAGSGTGRFLRVTMHLELRKPESLPDVEAAMVPIRSKLLIFFSQLDPSRIQDGEGKEAVREELTDAVNEVLGARVIRRVFYTEFVAQ